MTIPWSSKKATRVALISKIFTQVKMHNKTIMVLIWTRMKARKMAMLSMTRIKIQITLVNLNLTILIK